MNVRFSTAPWALLSHVPDAHTYQKQLGGAPEEEGGCDAARPAHGVKEPRLGSVRQEQSHTQSVNPEGSGSWTVKGFLGMHSKLVCLFPSSCLLTWP